MLNLPQQLAPLSWDEYYGHEREKRIILRSLEGGSATLPNSMFITGTSGTGKTSLINLIIRSLLCESPRSYSLNGEIYNGVNPCGECPYCRNVVDFRQHSGAHTNIMLIQGGSGEGETLNAQVKRALELASRPPLDLNNHREDFRVLVFDEWQLFPKNLRQQVLLKAELDVKNLNVMYFFITMAEDELPLTDLTAMVSRGLPIHLRAFTVEQIKDYLLNTLDAPKLQEREAYQIAKRSRGSLRMALAHYVRVAFHDTGLDYVQAETVQYFLNYTEAESRRALWEVIARGNYYDLKDVFTRVSSLYDFSKLNDLALDLISDIVEAMQKGRGESDEQLFALRIMYQYIANYQKLELKDYLLQLNGLNLGVV